MGRRKERNQGGSEKKGERGKEMKKRVERVGEGRRGEERERKG